MKDYNALGITVRYPFPRAGVQSQPEQDMKAIWCAKDRNKAFDDAMNGKGVQPLPVILILPTTTRWACSLA